jgi:hypothetical protein
MNCPLHPEARPRFQWQTHANGTRHIRRYCSVCKRFLRWEVQTAEIVAETEPEEKKTTEPSLFD